MKPPPVKNQLACYSCHEDSYNRIFYLANQTKHITRECNNTRPSQTGDKSARQLKEMADELLTEQLPDITNTMEERGKKKDRGWKAGAQVVLSKVCI